MADASEIQDVQHGGPDWGMPPWAEGGLLPAFTYIDGRNVALVDAGEYRVLLALFEAVGDPERVRAAHAAAVASLGGQASGPLSSPVPGRADEPDYVLVEAGTYRDLVSAAARKVAESGPRIVRRARTEPVGISTIERDPEVAQYLRELFPRRYTLAELHAACSERFGAERTPSVSRISTFRTRFLRTR